MAYRPTTMSSRSDRPFADRREAGKELAAKLGAYRGREDVVVLALPRGGVPVAFEVAEALDVPLISSLSASSGCLVTRSSRLTDRDRAQAPSWLFTRSIDHHRDRR
jgi:hypoxanthine phosphoribosyltransferase